MGVGFVPDDENNVSRNLVGSLQQNNKGNDYRICDVDAGASVTINMNF